MIHWTLIDHCKFNPVLEQLQPEDFLSEIEKDIYSGFRFEKRKQEWLRGRWAAKKLTQVSFPNHIKNLQRLSVLNNDMGKPYLKMGRKLPVEISLTHREGMAACALTKNPGITIGIDLEYVETRSKPFINDYFTRREKQAGQSQFEQRRDFWFTLCWSAKESYLKALGQGLRIDTRKIEVLPVDESNQENGLDGWQGLSITCRKNRKQVMKSYYRTHGNYVITLTVLFHSSLAYEKWQRDSAENLISFLSVD